MTIAQSKSSKSVMALWRKIRCFAVGSLKVTMQMTLNKYKGLTINGDVMSDLEFHTTRQQFSRVVDARGAVQGHFKSHSDFSRCPFAQGLIWKLRQIAF